MSRWSWSVGGMILPREYPSKRIKTFPVTLTTTNSIWNGLLSKPVLWDLMPAIASWAMASLLALLRFWPVFVIKDLLLYGSQHSTLHLGVFRCRNCSSSVVPKLKRKCYSCNWIHFHKEIQNSCVGACPLFHPKTLTDPVAVACVTICDFSCTRRCILCLCVILKPEDGPTGCPETSVRNCHYSLRNNPEDRSSHLCCA